MWGCILNFSASYFHCRITEKVLILQNKVVCLQREVTKADSSSSTFPLETERLSIAAETQWAHFLATFFKQQKTKQFCTISFFFFLNVNVSTKPGRANDRIKASTFIDEYYFSIALRRYKIKEFKNFSFSRPRFHTLQSPFSFSPADLVLLSFYWTWDEYYEIEGTEVREARN